MFHKRRVSGLVIMMSVMIACILHYGFSARFLVVMAMTIRSSGIRRLRQAEVQNQVRRARLSSRRTHCLEQSS